MINPKVPTTKTFNTPTGRNKMFNFVKNLGKRLKCSHNFIVVNTEYQKHKGKAIPLCEELTCLKCGQKTSSHYFSYEDEKKRKDKWERYYNSQGERI